ncbi:sulfotransferase family protein [Thiorhodococcus fuscus]|uniref:Sulfotransferase n=1 Tax=Thiorhodococcus fuscus TaxID=527200 RepID=A0ABW4YC53_9GAMM
MSLDMSGKHCVFVIGMHRSGTSAVAEVLSGFGLHFGRDLLGANEWNPHGHFESLPFVRLNDTLLAAGDAHWHTLFPSLPDLESMLDRFRAQALKVLEEDFGGESVIAVKDPRLCRLLPFWRAVLEEAEYRLSYLLVVRHPYACAESLLRRDRFENLKSYWLWGSYLLEALQAVDPSASFLVHYETLIDDPAREQERIRTWLGDQVGLLTLPAGSVESQTVDSALSHASCSALDFQLPHFVARLYQCLQLPDPFLNIEAWLPDLLALANSDQQEDLPRLLALVEREVERKDRMVAHYEQETANAQNEIEELVAEIAHARHTIDGLVAEIDRAREAHAERDRREADFLARIRELECESAHGNRYP